MEGTVEMASSIIRRASSSHFPLQMILATIFILKAFSLALFAGEFWNREGQSPGRREISLSMQPFHTVWDEGNTDKGVTKP